ncbi:MAG: excinuclease ABC subunit UvrB [Candidatus Komeilibacteria bacterium]
MKFRLKAQFKPTGDQPQAIKALVKGVQNNMKGQVLRGVTGSGKTFTMANVINQVQKPTLIISHNKTLAAQLAAEFQEFFPDNAVHYFVSYYDYYQPEAYVPSTDTYIEKETDINEEIDRLRHASTQSLLTRKDVIIIASVSCIYNLGNPVEYAKQRLGFKLDTKQQRDDVLRQLVKIQYERNDYAWLRGTFRVKGDILDIFPVSSDNLYWQIEFFGDKIEKINQIHMITGKKVNQEEIEEIEIFPAKHYVAPTDRMKKGLAEIRQDIKKQVKQFGKKGKLIEAQRIEQRTKYDLEMIEATGFCSGIENYSRYFDGREIGQAPYTLMDYFPKDFITFIDESHMTIPQIGAMYAGDQARKKTLIDFGFRLPSALDNRPMNFKEFENKVNQVLYVSATPGKYELLEKKLPVIEQLIRPTGLLDPSIEVRSTKGQVQDLLAEIKIRIKKKQRVLVTTLTKRMSEDLAEYLQEKKIKVHYLHSEVNTFDRIEVLKNLRQGKVDVVVGINLLREGLDLPEVSLVAILDADKEGFLRSEISMIQTMGRAARHSEGHVIMYADKITGSMDRAIKAVTKNRKFQEKYNKEHNITPQSIIKKQQASLAHRQEEKPAEEKIVFKYMSPAEKKGLLIELNAKMELAAQNLEFERAIDLREQIKKLKKS